TSHTSPPSLHDALPICASSYPSTSTGRASYASPSSPVSTTSGAIVSPSTSRWCTVTGSGVARLAKKTRCSLPRSTSTSTSSSSGSVATTVTVSSTPARVPGASKGNVTVTVPPALVGCDTTASEIGRAHV